MRLWKQASIVLLISLFAVSVAAQEATCPAIVEMAIDASDEFCQGINRNQACYGHVAINAVPNPQAPAFTFQQTGDVVDVANLQSVQLSPMDTTTGNWGVAVFRIQANLPNTLPGQNVTILVFGDTQITNAGRVFPSFDGQVATLEADLNVRLAPSAQSAVLGELTSGDTVSLVGRNADSAWVLVNLPQGGSGWVASEFISSVNDLSTLEVIEPGQPVYGPMQSFHLQTGVGEPACAEVPNSGIMVQTPQGAGTVTLAINEVQVALGSTLFFRAQPGNQMVVSVVEGAALVEAAGDARPVLAGGRVRIPLDTNGLPANEPSVYEPYDMRIIAPLPVRALERAITVAQPVTQAQADAVTRYEAYFEQIDLQHYDDLLQFVTENADASEGEVTAFLQSLGYSF
jgi:uncharacterized protein YgiM (DUF1202 family)